MLDYKILLNSETNTFNPGTEFSGRIIVNSEKEMKARKIDLKIHGRARTLWYVSAGAHGELADVGCQEDYINQYMILWESSDGSNRLPPGLYQFPFTVKIPPNIPGTYFKKDWADIKYYIETKIEVPWGFGKNCLHEFYVQSILDLNIDQKLSLQAYMEAKKTYARFCSCKTNSISLKVTLPKTGYICNETIHISMDISNKTSSKITEIEIGFIEEYIFIGNIGCKPQWPTQKSSRKEKEKIVFRQMYQPPMNENVTNVYKVAVPNSVGPSIQCSIIKVAYNLFVKVHTSETFKSGPEIKMPITIGTIPIQEKPISSQTSVVGEGAANSDIASTDKKKSKSDPSKEGVKS